MYHRCFFKVMEMRWGPKFWYASVFCIKDGNYEVATCLQGCQDQVGVVQMHPLSGLSATKMILHKRWTCGPSTWSWPPSRSLVPLSVDLSLPNASTYQNSDLYCIPMTWKRYLWFTDSILIYRLMIDTWEEVQSVYLILISRTLAGMYIFVDKIIKGKINDT